MTTTSPPPELQRVLDRLDVRTHDDEHLQYEAICPAHEDNAPSLSVSWGENESPVLFCHAGCTYEEIAAELDLPKSKPLKPRRRVTRNIRPAELPEIDPRVVFDNHDQLLSGKSSRHLDYLTTQRGLTLDTIQFWKLGSDGDRIVIPIRYRGKWVQLRRYKPGATKNKMLNLAGHGTAVLAFTESFRGNTLPILACEGELDAIVAWQHAEGRYAVTTGTGGASVVPRDLSLLADREVFIAYDLDDAGRDGAAKFAKAATAAQANAYVLDLGRLGLK
jgi:hypothetical protein